MIPYIQPKSVDYEVVQQLLSYSSLKNHWTNNGPVKVMLEELLHAQVELPSNKSVLCVSNGTTALHAIMWLYERRFGRKLKWVTPSFNFPSCAVNRCNTTIVDIAPDTFTIDERELDNLEYDGIIITNLFGSILNFDYEKYKDKIVIVDNASSFMTRNISLMGDISFSSLHHTKTLGFGEGGFIVCDKDEYDELQSIIGFGFTLLDRTYKPDTSNFKMSDVSAAFIIQHIINYDIEKHFEIQNIFRERLNNVEGITLFDDSPDTFLGNLPVIFDKPTTIDFFRNAGIEVNKYYKPLKSLKHSNELYDRIINFPLYSTLSAKDISHICDAIENYHATN